MKSSSDSMLVEAGVAKSGTFFPAEMDKTGESARDGFWGVIDEIPVAARERATGALVADSWSARAASAAFRFLVRGGVVKDGEGRWEGERGS